ncbi:MAG TPA: nuclear transport factor 2 family protein [Sphingomonadaceae bacterium]|nr:nuclear transport factor 2 family protein [Sphingomonadaceae bacterium]
MKTKFASIVGAMLAGTMLAAAPAAAQMKPLSDPVVGHPDPESLFTSDDPVLHRNKQAALHIQRNLLKCNEWSRAGEWLTDAYIQHNPVAASGLEGVVYYFTQVARRPALDPCPALSADDPNAVVTVSAEGDYVTILTKRSLPWPGDPTKMYTTTWFDTWRFVDGKADEHWDPATLPAWAPESNGVDAELLRARDREAIEELMWRYDRALDRFEADKYAALFTEDGSFGETRGRDALFAMVDAFNQREGGPPRLYHASTNHWIEFTGRDTATIHYYWQTYRAGEGQDTPASLVAVGNGVDKVVRVDGKWLYHSRQVVAPDD